MKADMEARLKRAHNLPSPPGVALRIIELAQSPSVDLGQIADTISADPALSVKLLRIANSPLYALRRRCDNLQQTLSLLGLNAALTLALSFSMVKGLDKEEGATRLDYGYFWRRSLLAAAAARQLALRLKLGSASEELFLCALLQDIGMLALDRLDPELYANFGSPLSDHKKVTEYERRQLDDDHAEVGRWLLEAWQLPESIVESVGLSHSPFHECDNQAKQTRIRCLALSGTAADCLLAGEGEQGLLFQELACAAEQSIGMDNNTVEEMLTAVGEQMHDLESLFEMDLLNHVDLEGITDQAREAMMVRNLQMLEEVRQLRSTAENLEQRAQLAEEQGRRDALTGRFNRAYLDKAVKEEFKRAAEQGWPLSVAFADLDHFKNVNDNYGHAVGDQVLKRSAELIEQHVRQADLVARYGGEEFVILLPGSDGHATQAVAERIVNAFRGCEHETADGMRFTVTISIGIASQNTVTHFESPKELLLAADQALYQAKSQGRNRASSYRQSQAPQRTNLHSV